jgi:cyclohexa-1,5-dienecarbonyl-CoA hydratase
LELALACDFIFASQDARFGQPEIQVAAIPPVAAVLLPQPVGAKKALEMILSGETLGAAEALEWGLANAVAPPEELETRVDEFSQKILGQSPRVLELARRAARAAWRPAFESALREAERTYLEELLRTDDAVEGLRAFIEKRPPRWKGK